MKEGILSCIMVLLGMSLWAQEEIIAPQRVAHTQKLENNVVLIDGHLDDVAWDLVEWNTDFTVHFPNNGELPERQTQFKVLYDEAHVYFGFRCWHEDITQIENRLARRDNFPGDWVEVNIDSYHDLSTAFSFTTSVSGVKGDEYVTANGNNWDSNWNPIWYNATQIDSLGWTAEVKIPLSQLRFGIKDQHVWGINVMRRDFKADERSTWQWIPQTSAGWVSNFGKLKGIKGIQPKNPLELQPYIVTELNNQAIDPGNTLRSDSEFGLEVGLDGKIGVTNDFTVDFTINPDFGQVDADPSAIRIDGSQIFFAEQRPFFIENNNLYSFQFSNLEAGGSFWNDNLFYSRRIGSAPRGSSDVPDNGFEERPKFSRILGSAKFSGKTKKGLSVAILESVTAEEKAKILSEGEVTEQIIDPRTNYLVGSVYQDIKQGESQVGVLFTALNRSMDGTGLDDQLHRSAYAGGLSLFHSWQEREWQLRGNLVWSQVNGSREKITETQESFEHYFQRPDASYLSVDTNATSLEGFGGTVSVANYGGEDNISFQSGLTWRSPEVEFNDLGFMNSADRIDHVTWVGYRAPKPFAIFRGFRVNGNSYFRWNYGGKHLYTGLNFNAHFNFKNYWNLSTGLDFEVKDISQKALFGGPLIRQNTGLGPWLRVSTDSRKKMVLSANTFRFNAHRGNKGALKFRRYGIGVTYQPKPALSLSFEPEYSMQDRQIQYVDNYMYQGQERYITARIKQETLSASIRLNYSLTPNMTFQYWGQPFVSQGRYSQFKYITDPLARNYQDRFELYGDDQITFVAGDDEYNIGELGSGFVDHSFGNPDFNVLEFRSNLVFRWEYKPGSEFFLVWTQSNEPEGNPDNGVLRSLSEDLLGNSGTNVFLMKFTYRFYRI